MFAMVINGSDVCKTLLGIGLVAANLIVLGYCISVVYEVLSERRQNRKAQEDKLN